jgi:5'-3' exonuclease
MAHTIVWGRWNSVLKPTFRAQLPSLLIDASIYIFQYYFSMPDNWFSKKDAWPTAAVYGYMCFLIRLLKEQKPEKIAACFDESLNSCFHH